MEKLQLRSPRYYFALGVSALVFAGCSIDSYLSNPANVQCDDRRTKVDLSSDGTVTFIVHGNEDGDSDVATIKVRRESNMVSTNTSGEVTGPPQVLEADGYTKPTPIVEGPELSAFGAGGAWIIDARDDSVVIQGSCEGM